MTDEEKQTLHRLFHMAWGQAKESPEYDKDVWRKLDILLSKLKH